MWSVTVNGNWRMTFAWCEQEKALSEFVNEKASLSPEMALRISKATNTSVESWMNMQQKLTRWNAYRHEPTNVIPFPLGVAKEG